MLRNPDRAMVAEELDKFIIKVESQWESESLPIILATQMLHTLPAQRPCAMEVLRHSWLAPPLFGADTPAPLMEGGRPPGSHPKPPGSEAAPLMEAPPSSGEPAQPTSEVAALKGATLTVLGRAPGSSPQTQPHYSVRLTSPTLGAGGLASLPCSGQITRPA